MTSGPRCSAWLLREPRLRHFGDALVAQIMKADAVEWLRRAPARCFRITPHATASFAGFIACTLRRCLHESSPCCSESLLIPGEVKVPVLARRENEVLRRTTAKSIRALAKPGEPGHGFIVQRNQSVSGFRLAALVRQRTREQVHISPARHQQFDLPARCVHRDHAAQYATSYSGLLAGVRNR